MLKGCPVACNECKNECGDHNTECKKWASRGECRKNAPYMDIYCAKVILFFVIFVRGQDGLANIVTFLLFSLNKYICLVKLVTINLD